ncbi:uncharacterized protein GIQ15_04292 [Arthroderma uncinatum]|uniref:uncharacterized protein n=1 Tax=Arthroderma uncinatum TaxID=74035 RepID=UPI00144AEFC5|nr:uncharacterized protein GIQ15_04292 [Arthroderma uncinatum]KAF3481533.1 hypothetical protein GIQ15_04292 [Arthroderma uncinatum]
MGIERRGAVGRKQRTYTTGLPQGYFAQVREQHAQDGPTKRVPPPNTQVSMRTLMNKLEQEWIKTLEAPDAKAFFNWLRVTHGTSIKRESVPHSYWRRIMVFYRNTEHRSVDKAIQEDVEALSKDWGLLPPKPKEPASKKVIYSILVTNWARCEKVYADERQRLQVSAGILLGCISSSRIVSLFDTRKGESSAQTQQVQSRLDECAPQAKTQKVFDPSSPVANGLDPPVGTGLEPADLTSDVSGEGDFNLADLAPDGSVTDDGFNAGPEETGPSCGDISRSISSATPSPVDQTYSSRR